jgi:hypothetical protein
VHSPLTPPPSSPAAGPALFSPPQPLPTPAAAIAQPAPALLPPAGAVPGPAIPLVPQPPRSGRVPDPLAHGLEPRSGDVRGEDEDSGAVGGMGERRRGGSRPGSPHEAAAQAAEAAPGAGTAGGLGSGWAAMPLVGRRETHVSDTSGLGGPGKGERAPGKG